MSTIPHVYIVGADKGGVGKTTVSRLLLDYLDSNGIANRAFDTESPTGSLKRFFPNKTEVVDLTRSDDQMKVFDTLGTSPVTLIDIRAGLLSPMLKTLSEIGFLAAAREGKLKITVLHVLGPAVTSIEEIAPIVAALGNGSRHIAIANHINDTDFNTAPDGALQIGKLDERAAEAVDKAGQPFTEFVNGKASFVLSGYVRHWMGLAFDSFNTAKLNVLA